MTIREVYESVLIELNKVQAPSLLLDDFVYIFNKAIQLYFNKRYTLFEMNQLLTDDLRTLTKTEKLTPVGSSNEKFYLPDDYVHILNCICIFKGPKSNCDTDNFQQGANKLDTNQWSQVINNYYMKPSIKRPYYYIINSDDPKDEIKLYTESNKNGKPNKRIEGKRYGNYYKPVVEIKCGKDQNRLESVLIDYLRAPRYIDLTVDELDEIEDSTENLEFPDYVIYEIIREIVSICMENAKDQRLQTYIPINTSILNLTTLK